MGVSWAEVEVRVNKMKVAKSNKRQISIRNTLLLTYPKFSKKKMPENALDELIFAIYGNPPPPKRAKVTQAVTLAHELLMKKSSLVRYHGSIYHGHEQRAMKTPRPRHVAPRSTSSVLLS